MKELIKGGVAIMGWLIGGTVCWAIQRVLATIWPILIAVGVIFLIKEFIESRG